MHPLLIAAIAKGGFSVTYILAATEVINSTSPEGQTSDAQYIFNTDGTVQERRDLSGGGTSLTTSAGSPWSDDPSEAGTGKYIKLVHATGTDRRTDALGNGFLELTSQRLFTFQNTDTSGPYNDASTYTVTLSLDGSTPYDTQTLTVNLDNAGP
jgi:hypothetical protein